MGFRLLSNIKFCSRFVFIVHRFEYLLFLGSCFCFLMRGWLLLSCTSNRRTSVTFFCCSAPWGLDLVSHWPCDVCARSLGSSVASGSLCQISVWGSFSYSFLQSIVLSIWLFLCY